MTHLEMGRGEKKIKLKKFERAKMAKEDSCLEVGCSVLPADISVGIRLAVLPLTMISLQGFFCLTEYYLICSVCANGRLK